jgi:hypothetical protein
MRFLFLAAALSFSALAIAAVEPAEPKCITELRTILSADSESAKRYRNCTKVMNGKDETVSGEEIHLYPFDSEKTPYETLSIYLGSTDYSGPMALKSSANAKVSCADDGSVVSEIPGMYLYKVKAQEKTLTVSFKNFSASPDYQLEYEAKCGN